MECIASFPGPTAWERGKLIIDNIGVPFPDQFSKMAAPVLVDPGPVPPGFIPQERDLARSEEEEKLLKKIREEKERLWCEIQVSSVPGGMYACEHKLFAVRPLGEV